MSNHSVVHNSTNNVNRKLAFGLNRPSKRPAIDLGGDDDDDDNSQEKIVHADVQARGTNKEASRQTIAQAIVQGNVQSHGREDGRGHGDIYEYDSVYDAMKQRERAGKLSAKDDKRPRYMQKLLAAAQQRKQDQLIARDRVLQREREREGDNFADKESFVTESYKRQQHELRKAALASEAKDREEEQTRGGIANFYRKWLDEDDKLHRQLATVPADIDTEDKSREQASQRHQEQMETLTQEEQSRSSTASEKFKNDRPEDPLQEQIRKAREQGRDIVVNDDNEVVDKRQLLSAGLNLNSRKLSHDERRSVDSRSAEYLRRDGRTDNETNARRAREEQRIRQTAQLRQQMRDSEREKAELDRKKHEALAEQSQSRYSREQVQSARERYLARKAASASQCDRPDGNVG